MQGSPILCKDRQVGPKMAKTPEWQRKEGQNAKGGLNEKGRKSYEKQNPGSDLKAPVKSPPTCIFPGPYG
jgi:hypothetical protein